MAPQTRFARNFIAAFATGTLALSAFAPSSLAYAAKTAGNAAAGGGSAIVVTEEGFNPSAFSQAGLQWEALLASDDAVAVETVEYDAETDIAKAAAQGSVKARALADEGASPEGAAGSDSFDLAQSIAAEAANQGTPAQTGTSYQKQAELQEIYLVSCSTLDDAATVQRASGIEGVLFAEADQVIAEGVSDTEDGEEPSTDGADPAENEPLAGDEPSTGNEPSAEGEPSADTEPSVEDEPSTDTEDSTPTPPASPEVPVENGITATESDDPQPAPRTPLANADLTVMQWHLGETGSMRNAEDPIDINIPSDMDGSVAAGESAPVIAVVDTGIDYNNPALQPSMLDLSQYDGLMADTGCGKYGINATVPAGEPGYDDPMDYNSHGTHVGGIIAANGDVKGVNPHAKLVGVQVIADSGAVYTSAIVRGLGWLVEAKEHGVNIEGFNFSIGGMTGVTYAARAAFALAEENDIVAFVAAGNNGSNVDDSENLLTAVQMGSTVVVDAAEANGEPSYYSNYGKRTTDLFAPGSGIMATFPNSMATFQPAVSKLYDEALVYEGFEPAGSTADDDVSDGFAFHYADGQAVNELGGPVESTTNRFYLGSTSLSVVADQYRKVESEYLTSHCRVATIVSEPKDLTVMTDWQQPSVDNPLRFGMSAFSDFYPIGENLSANFQAMVSFKLENGTWSEPANSSSKGSNGDEWLELPALAPITVPENADFEHFQMKIEISALAVTFEELPKSVTVCLDSIGLGYGTHPYCIQSGTSMATPVTAGAYSLLRAEHPQESTQRTSARIVGGTKSDSRLTDLCATGGRLDVASANSNPRPVLSSAAYENGLLNLEGWFLGSAGTVNVGGTPAEVVSWTADTETQPGTIQVKVPEGIAGSQIVTLQAADGSSAQISALITERITDFEDLPLPDFDEYDLAELGALAFADGSVYLQTVSIPEGSCVLDLFRYDPSTRSWTHVDSHDTGAAVINNSIGLVSLDSQLYRLVGDGDPIGLYMPSTLSLHRFDKDAGTFEATPIKFSEPVGTPEAVMAWDGALLALAGSVDDTDNLLHVVRIDPRTGDVNELGTLPIEPTGATRAAAITENTLYLHIPTDPLDNTSIDQLMICPLDDLASARIIDLPCFDKTLPYSITLAASDGDVAILNMPGYPDQLDGAYADVWVLKDGSNEVVPSDIMLQLGSSAEGAALIVGDTLYAWGVSREVDQRTYFRSISLSALGMEAEKEAPEKQEEPEQQETDKPALPGTLADTGDDFSSWTFALGALALGSALTAGIAAFARRASERQRDK